MNDFSEKPSAFRGPFDRAYVTLSTSTRQTPLAELPAPVQEEIPISQLPLAGPLFGSEMVPIVQNGITCRATAGAIAVSASPPASLATYITTQWLIVLGTNLVSGLAFPPDGRVMTVYVNGRAFFDDSNPPSFSLEGQTIVWSDPLYSFGPGDEVLATYTYAGASSGGGGGGGSGIPEPPTDGSLYGRRFENWTNIAHTDITDWAITLARYAPIDSPAFTGTPSLPLGSIGATALTGDASSTLATTQFVANAITAIPPIPGSTTPPVMDGMAAPGTSTLWSRGDHVHPSDTSRLPVTGGAIIGNLSISGVLTVTGSNSVVLSGAAGQQRGILGQTAGVSRWQLLLGDQSAESGSNAGSNFALSAASDAGAVISTPLSINRATGVATFSAAIVNGPSDRTLKENIEPLEGALAKVQALKGVSFNWKVDGRRDIGLIAQDVEPVVPEIVQQFREGENEPKMALDYPKLTALLIEAVKTLAARVEELESGAHG